MKSAWEREYIIEEIKALKESLKRIFKDEPEHIRKYWEPVTRYLLGEDNNVLDELSIDDINTILSDLLISLRYPASAPPFNIPTPHVDILNVFNKPELLFARIDNFFDQFNDSSTTSILGWFFSVLQKELMKHFCVADNYTVFCTPISIGGIKIGFLAYFPKAEKMNIPNEFDVFRPFKSHNISDNTRDYYRSFYTRPVPDGSIPGAVLLYLYSGETNSYFLTSGKGLLPVSCFRKKQEIKQLRNKIMKSSDGIRRKRASVAGKETPLPLEKMKKNLYMVLRMAQYSCLQAFETKKNYADTYIREKIGRIEGETVPFHLIFESLSWFVPLSGAILWGRERNQQWAIQEVEMYTQHSKDNRECRLTLLKDKQRLSDLEKKYAELLQGFMSVDGNDLPTIFNSKKPVLKDLGDDVQRQLSSLFEYSQKSWSWSLDCKSRFVIPVNDPDVPNTIIEIYFNEPAGVLNLTIHDITRMVARLYDIMIKEVNVQLLIQNELRHKYMGMLAHEIRNWFPQVKRKIDDLEEIVNDSLLGNKLRPAQKNIRFAQVRLKYFSDIFEIVLAELRREKYGFKEQEIRLDRIMSDVKEAVIDLCVHDTNYRYPIGQALTIPDSQEGDNQLRGFLQERIQIGIKPKGLIVNANETLIFTCLQEMLKNAVSKQDWSNKENLRMEARAISHERVGLRVTNTPEIIHDRNLQAYSRSLAKGEPYENEGFGGLWLKSIKRLLDGKFDVPSQWLVEKTSEEDYPPHFWLEIIIPSQTGKKE